MSYCKQCGSKLVLKYCENEGLIPFCDNCGKFKFPDFSCAVSMIVVNKAHDKILLAKHNDKDDYLLFAGYVKKGESVEKAILREINEEIKLNVIKFRYLISRTHEPKDILMLNFAVVVSDGVPIPNANEIEEVKWFDFDAALDAVHKDSTAEFFLKNAIPELKKGKFF